MELMLSTLVLNECNQVYNELLELNAAYSMDDILFTIREHAIALNCGIWDYCSSIIGKFGDSPKMLLSDRGKYVNMEKPFFMKLLIATCHRRNAIATGGMAAQLVPTKTESVKECQEIIRIVKNSKRLEINRGIDGFMVYDFRLVPEMNNLWKEMYIFNNQIKIIPDISEMTPESLIEIPREEGVTIECLRHNIAVALLFIYHWLSGSGVFYYKNCIEDSATAEIFQLHTAEVNTTKSF